MCERLDYFLDEFSRLGTDGSKKNRTGLTYNPSPYEPFLLLTVLDFIESGIITRNFIEPSFELAQTFQNYCALLDRPVFKPSASRYWPDQDNLAWHRNEKFVKYSHRARS